jgi:hypothetical protein
MMKPHLGLLNSGKYLPIRHAGGMQIEITLANPNEAVLAAWNQYVLPPAPATPTAINFVGSTAYEL